MFFLPLLATQRSIGLTLRCLLMVIGGFLFLLLSRSAYAGDSAQFISQSVPNAMIAGHTYSVSVTMKNNGDTDWIDWHNSSTPYKLGSQNPQDNSTWGTGRVELPSSPVAPGSAVTFSFNLTAPSTPGSYAFQWRMVHETITWFGDFAPTVNVNVVAPTAVGPVTVTDITLSPNTIHLHWDSTPLTSGSSSSPPSGPNQSGGSRVYEALHRSPDGPGWPVSAGSGPTDYSDTNWSFDTRYAYYLTGTDTSWSSVSDSNSSTGYSWQVIITHFTTLSSYVTVRKIAVTANQTVTTRTDPRYSTYTLAKKGVGYSYGTSLYRGGLFAGYNYDGANVARTYLKWDSLLGPLSGNEGDQLWPIGGMSLYCTRLARDGSTSLLCRPAVSSGWDPATLAWSNAPAVTSDPSGMGSFSLSWSSTSPSEQWVTLNNLPDLQSALSSGANSLTEILLSPSESNGNTSATFPITASYAGWAYFAKSTYTEGTGTNTQTFPAYLIYAFGGPGISVSVATNYPSVSGGSSATGIVSIPFSAPSSGVVVSLSSSNPAVASVPATVTIPAGQTSTTFTVSTSSVSSNTSVTITAALRNTSASTTLVVTTGTGTGNPGSGTPGSPGSGTPVSPGSPGTGTPVTP